MKVSLFSILLLILADGFIPEEIITRHDKADQAYIDFAKELPVTSAIVRYSRTDVAGTLIAPQWVLSAAHVAETIKEGHRLILGKDSLDIETIIIHPGWLENRFPEDIALIKLKEKVIGVEPVPLYTHRDEAGKEVILIGNGDFGTGLTGPKGNDGIFRAATNRVDQANQHYLVWEFSDPNDQTNKATRLEGISGPGDSSSPAFIKKDDTYHLAGVSSWQDTEPTDGRSGRYNVIEYYPRVSTYIQWIEQTISTDSDFSQNEPIPIVDHHKHLISPAAAEWSSGILLPEVSLPEELNSLFHKRSETWDDLAELQNLYVDEKFAHDDKAYFSGSPDITPIAYNVNENMAYVLGYFAGESESDTEQINYVLLILENKNNTGWKISNAPQHYPNPSATNQQSSDMLISELDAAELQHAVVLSLAYWFGSDFREHINENEYEKVIAENNWISQQASQYPRRIKAFCSFNPLKDYALMELKRCAEDPNLIGLKFHFGNSQVDLQNSEHLLKLRSVFKEVNNYQLPIIVHLWTGPEYEREGQVYSQIFLDELLPLVTESTVQIAHFAGGGPGYTDSALAVFAQAIASGDARTKNLYFDLATVADQQSEEALNVLAQRIRQIGAERILWGTDNPQPAANARQSWSVFRNTVQLTDSEFKTIAENIAPYLRQ